MTEPALQIRDLAVEYPGAERRVQAVDGVSLSLRAGAVQALVGESGCGKTTLALAVLGLLPNPGRVSRGEIRFAGRDLLSLGEDEQRATRGREISMIFQDPVSGLNPVLSIGKQVEEAVTAHLRVSRADAHGAVCDALDRVGLAEPEQLVKRYPFELSGGMCQRVIIAIATILRPKVIIADEPTSALDVTVQAGILRELERLREEQGVSILLISHDLGVVAQMADEVSVMYAGRLAEQGSARAIFGRPRHPYTSALLASLPRVDRAPAPLEAIPGAPPDPAALPDECAFLPRCRKATMQCRTSPSPALTDVGPEQRAACYNPMYQAEA